MAELVALRLALPRRVEREPLDALLAALTPRPARSLNSAGAVPNLRRDLLRTEWVVRHVPGLPNTCLYRALARYAVLRRTGMDAAFVMGLGPKGVDDDGHAWVEVGGKPYEEPDDVTRFAITFRYPPASNL
ncbi:MAG TPA: lasso peptide biosynthesis B2 protein [Polyangiaceae bacterium]|nr:lasso peptide biosynthesis B2 protein [Polyangiaceae bacterium]